ncbi:hypothetical protein LY474_40410 [Myxococcus stipitatus]|uniref:hypothetical protein n=1 Tax=Myxococcus stipitatus TaxID=83455 RepID=UPI001F4791C2|nr:hypothetical protein [Myxococcus stipitatus]MCE9674073.1 hypothetical protein [Myxococcus stipitatus]
MTTNGTKGPWVALALLTACGGAGGAPSLEDPASGPRAQGYDAAQHCLVDSSQVLCPSGIYAYAQWSDEVGWYIERDACGTGPTVCPL